MHDLHKIKSVIIDDEPKSQSTLNNLLINYLPEIVNIGTFDSLKTSITFIKEQSPDLIFLDIELQGESGLDIIKYFPKMNFDIIFTTAYAQYALDAIKLSAIDYLLKPIGITDLQTAVTHLIEKRIYHNSRIDKLVTQYHQYHKLAIHTPHGFTLLNLDDIIYCEADHNYTTIFLVNDKKVLANNPLRYFEELLCQLSFFRINRSELINLNFLKDFSKNTQGEITLTSGKKLNLSNSRKESFIEAIQKISY